jgi:hypothetical protein
MEIRSVLCAIGLSVVGVMLPSCAEQRDAEQVEVAELSVANQAVPLPTWKKVPFAAANRTQLARLLPIHATSIFGLASSPGTVDLPDEVLINECEDLEGVTFPVNCTLGAVTCTCYVTTTTCTENAAGNCDCGYTVNGTASNCH